MTPTASHRGLLLIQSSLDRNFCLEDLRARALPAVLGVTGCGYGLACGRNLLWGKEFGLWTKPGSVGGVG